MSDYLSFAIALAKEAGALLMGYHGKIRPEMIGYKGWCDLVTVADRASEAMVTQAIAKRFPDHGIWAEEGTRAAGREWLWLIDPLDGTTNFAHGHSYFAVSLGLAHQGTMKVGVVYAPYLNELFYAEEGQGAFLNGQPIRVSPTENFAQSLLCTGFAYNRRETSQNNVDNFSRLLMECQDIRRCGAASLEQAYVAGGRYDGFWELWLQGHDVAAGSLLVREAGGCVTDFNGSQDYLWGRSIIATNGRLHRALREKLAPFSP